MTNTKEPHITPSKQRFLDAQRVEYGTLISYKHQHSEEVLEITRGKKYVIPAQGNWCTAHGGFSYEPCSCAYETRID